MSADKSADASADALAIISLISVAFYLSVIETCYYSQKLVSFRSCSTIHNFLYFSASKRRRNRGRKNIFLAGRKVGFSADVLGGGSGFCGL